MYDVTNILISLECRYALSILEGRKSVELRRRTPCIGAGTTVWIYSKKPKAAVEVVASLAHILTASPDWIWRKYGDQTGITRREFDAYFRDSTTASALILDNIERLQRPVTLIEMRALSTSFQPPQFYFRLRPKSTTLELLESGLQGANRKAS